MKIKRFLTLVLSAALPVFVFAGGETGGDVLKVDAGNRASGMAGAYTAAGAGVESIFYNPAGMSSLLKTKLFTATFFPTLQWPWSKSLSGNTWTHRL